MKAIVAVNNLGFIGKGNELLWRNTKDLSHFKKLTKGCKLLVGYNTYSGLPELPGRTLIVVDKMEHSEAHYYECEWCIGGKSTYERFCKDFTELHISHIDDDSIGDVTFPDLSKLNPKCKIFNYNF
jgi:dihydrofolate reductase